MRSAGRAISAQLPVEGVDLILGNDLAGGKVFLQPIFVDTHEVLKELSALKLVTSRIRF